MGNLGAKIIERESEIKPRSEEKEKGFKIMPDAVIGWEPASEPIKDPEIFERVTKLVNDELKNFFRPEFLNRIDEIIVFNHLTRIDIWEICALMIKQVQNRLKEKEIELIVDQSVKAFLTDEGYDPIYGARPLRRAIMKYLEDTLAEQCVSKILYPNTKIYVNRKRVDGTLMTYINELEVEINFDEVDPSLLKQLKIEMDQSTVNLNESENSVISNQDMNLLLSDKNNLNLNEDELKPSSSVRVSRFF